LNNPVLKLERDVFVYRAYIALKKYGVVINEIHGASPQELQPLKQLAEYFSQPTKR
jgi:poly(A) RNA polymerase GLD2/coatomer protein complex subunit epsilon